MNRLPAMKKMLLLGAALTLSAWANPDPAAHRLPGTTQIFASGRMLPPPAQTAELLRRIEMNPGVDMILEELPVQIPQNAVGEALGWMDGEVTFAWVRTGERSVVDEFALRDRQEAAYAELERKVGYLGPEVERFRKKFKRLPRDWQEMVQHKIRQSVPEYPHGDFVLTGQGVTVRYKGELQLEQVAEPPLWRFGQGLVHQTRKPGPTTNLLFAFKSADDGKCRQAITRLMEANDEIKPEGTDAWKWSFASDAPALSLKLAQGYLLVSDNPALLTNFLSPPPTGGLDQNPRYRFQREQLPASSGANTFAFADLEDLFSTTKLGTETLPEEARACHSVAFVYQDTPSNVSILPTAGRAEGLLQVSLPPDVVTASNGTANTAFLGDVSADSQIVYGVNLPVALRLAQQMAPEGSMLAELWKQLQQDSGVTLSMAEAAAATGWIVMESDVLDDVLADVKATFRTSDEQPDNLVKWLSRKAGSWTLEVSNPTVQESLASALWAKTGETDRAARGEGAHHYWMRSDGSWTLVSVPQKLLASSKLSRRLLLRTLNTMARPGSGLTRHTSLDEFRSHLKGDVLAFTSQKSDWVYSLIKGFLLLVDGQSRPEAEVLGRYRDTYAALTLTPEGVRMVSSFYSETPVRPTPDQPARPELAQLHDRIAADFKPVAAAAAANRAVERDVKSCQNNLKNLATACEMWATDHGGHYPTRLGQLMPNYLRRIPTCPSADQDTYSAHYKVAQKPDTFSIYCWGHHHKEAGVPVNRPAYNADLGLVPK